MRRVLIVSPRFVPSNAADMHRVRQALPYLRDFGWEPTVLAVTPSEVEALQDPTLETTIPHDVEVIRTGAIPIRYTRPLGVGSLEARALPHLLSAGRRVLERGGVDLVFFSTTAMGVTTLGPRWQKEFGVPFVVDMQDPWYSRYYEEHDVPPPGGRLKHAIANALAKRLEPYVLRRASHVVSVSPAYPRALAARYPWFSETVTSVLPFGAPESDFDVLCRAPISNRTFDPEDGRQHWVYVGAAGPIMRLSLEALFVALRRYRDANPSAASDLVLHFVGTDYAPPELARKTVEPLAEAQGVGDLVEEIPYRLPYFEALQCLLDADALIMPGSDDAGYTASKLFPYILAEKPLLALFHEASSVVNVLQQTEAGIVVTFREGATPQEVADRITASWFEPEAWKSVPQTQWGSFEPYTARAMTQRLTEIFNGVVEPSRTLG